MYQYFTDTIKFPLGCIQNCILILQWKEVSKDELEFNIKVPKNETVHFGFVKDINTLVKKKILYPNSEYIF